MLAGSFGWAVLLASVAVCGTPLTLLLMCLVLRLFGVPSITVRKRAIKLTDQWITRRGSSPISEVASALMSRQTQKDGARQEKKTG